MFARIASRVPVTAAFAGKRVAPATFRYNSSSSASSAARVMEMAAQAERPSGAEVAVPVMWAVSGVLAYTAWNRMSERTSGEYVEKLLIV
ncbi:hypothetical protein CFE70_004634 [Pyrenophora teres f. teres 0-1]|uniref:Uncharacterized protein n=1 Tax=Pyrenophora teres f. teres (strain 0-1) TaxID=861557 RepID=E3S2B7_PYRTT|nr:hypothetical protein PTT_16436 [Pyrenophora teres f. teres 0-1]KAE8864145.1 hypothetical protein PTNB29_04109 [Pyrenophora teres f. teres]CAA9961258.1 hypothetical protein PTMSG1_04642 [Pyrenophora teres f. maculata]